MQYKIIGKTFPAVECTMNAEEAMVCQSGAMIWMSDTFDMSTSAGGVGGMFKKMISGEGAFMNTYTAKSDGKIVFGATFAGDILPFKLDGSQTLIMQKKAFLASEKDVKLDIHFSKKVGAGFFGGEGFIMQKVTGTGQVFFEVDGNVHEITLAPEETLIVDSNNLVGFEGTAKMDVVTVAGLKNKLLGGEGLFNTKITGPGKVWLQTMALSSLVDLFLPKK